MSPLVLRDFPGYVSSKDGQVQLRGQQNMLLVDSVEDLLADMGGLVKLGNGIVKAYFTTDRDRYDRVSRKMDNVTVLAIRTHKYPYLFRRKLLRAISACRNLKLVIMEQAMIPDYAGFANRSELVRYFWAEGHDVSTKEHNVRERTVEYTEKQIKRCMDWKIDLPDHAPVVFFPSRMWRLLTEKEPLQVWFEIKFLEAQRWMLHLWHCNSVDRQTAEKEKRIRKEKKEARAETDEVRKAEKREAVEKLEEDLRKHVDLANTSSLKRLEQIRDLQEEGEKSDNEVKGWFWDGIEYTKWALSQKDDDVSSVGSEGFVDPKTAVKKQAREDKKANTTLSPSSSIPDTQKDQARMDKKANNTLSTSTSAPNAPKEQKKAPTETEAAMTSRKRKWFIPEWQLERLKNIPRGDVHTREFVGEMDASRFSTGPVLTYATDPSVSRQAMGFVKEEPDEKMDIDEDLPVHQAKFTNE